MKKINRFEKIKTTGPVCGFCGKETLVTGIGVNQDADRVMVYLSCVCGQEAEFPISEPSKIKVTKLGEKGGVEDFTPPIWMLPPV